MENLLLCLYIWITQTSSLPKYHLRKTTFVDLKNCHVGKLIVQLYTFHLIIFFSDTISLRLTMLYLTCSGIIGQVLRKMASQLPHVSVAGSHTPLV